MLGKVQVVAVLLQGTACFSILGEKQIILQWEIALPSVFPLQMLATPATSVTPEAFCYHVTELTAPQADSSQRQTGNGRLIHPSQSRHALCLTQCWESNREINRPHFLKYVFLSASLSAAASSSGFTQSIRLEQDVYPVLFVENWQESDHNPRTGAISGRKHLALLRWSLFQFVIKTLVYTT